MHYMNGREAHNGDRVVIVPKPGYQGVPIVGVLYDANPAGDFCNGRLAKVSSNDPCPNLRECLHVEDAVALMNGTAPASGTAPKA